MARNAKASDVVTIILCGGKGTRMNSSTLHKVCFEIGGVPAIHRTIQGLVDAGLRRFVVVLGSMGGQVMECISRGFPEATFAFQPVPRGTGDATRIGLHAVRRLGVCGPVMVVMGDKIVKSAVSARLVDAFREGNVAASFAVQPVENYQRGGRVVFDSAGEVRGIVEARDVEAAVKSGSTLTIAGTEYDTSLATEAQYVNAAVYLFDQQSLFQSLEVIGTDNTQGEYYLTDVIGRLAASGATVKAVPVTRRDDVLSFNTVDELLDVERVVLGMPGEGAKYPNTRWKSIGEWRQLLTSFPSDIRKQFEEVYGPEEDLIDDRRRAHLDALECFESRFGSAREVIMARAPGRVNLMGRHVEHRGGWVNVISINKEVVCVAARREDDMVRIVNTDPAFAEETFRISDHFRSMNWQSWTHYLDAGETQQMVLNARGNWVNYVKAAVLRLQYSVKHRPLRGMDMAFTGNIPMAAGLSSSSAVVVTSAEAAVAANGLDIEPQDFVDLCGEGEWYVGSRGGAGDHAAMKFGNRGSIARLGFFPFRFEGLLPFPEGCKLVIANSYVRAEKTTNARDIFNGRIAAYEFGLYWLLEEFPHLRSRVERLRDINPDTLDARPSEVYQMLARVPERATLDEIRRRLPAEFGKQVDRISATHSAPEHYMLRDVLLYGIAECKRSRDAEKLLAAGKVEEFGQLMNISHDGDRVVRHVNGEAVAYAAHATDEQVAQLREDLRSEDPERVYRAQVERQPGAYACSTPETDFLVDTANAVPGVLGSQLSGAGLGGCVMFLVREEAVDQLTEALNAAYYRPRGLESGITVCIPVRGSMVWDVETAGRTLSEK